MNILLQQSTSLWQELDAANKKEVEGALAGFLKSGEKALISYAVDASIVGGMVVSWRTFESDLWLSLGLSFPSS